MRLPPLVRGTLLRRLNRFAVLVDVSGQEAQAHLPNSVRLRELLGPGNPVHLIPRGRKGRKTAFNMALVEIGPTLVSSDTRLPLALVAEIHSQGRLPELAPYTRIRREPLCGEGRLDLLLEGDAEPCLVEVQSVTLVERGRALFPDTPTERGTRHVHSLLQAQSRGYKAVLIFVIQRGDTVSLPLWDREDPAFGRALCQAAAGGVELSAYLCDVSLGEVRLARLVLMLLSGRRTQLCFSARNPLPHRGWNR